MDSSVKKKLKIVLIAFAIILIPLGYVVKNLIAIHINDMAINSVYMEPHYGMSEAEIRQQAIAELDKAIKINKRNYLFYLNKAKFYFELNQYQNALTEVQKSVERNDYAELIVFQGVLNEYLNKRQKAIDLYRKALIKYKDRLSKQPDNLILKATIIMLNYIMDSDKEVALSNLEKLGKEASWENKHILDSFASYIYYCPENLLGMKSLNYGETVRIRFENFSEKDSVENLLIQNKISWESQGWASSDNNWIEFEINKIYLAKALELGFKVRTNQ